MVTSGFDGTIVIEALTKRFGSRPVVDGLSFRVTPGQVTGFLGPNGAGKSTTMKMLLGLVHPTGGTATIGGLAYQELPHPGSAVGAMLEPVQGQRTGRQHLFWMAAAAGAPRRAVDEKLELVGLGSAGDQRVARYSLGMRQRLALAGALLADPHVLILDEPINGLDAEGILWMRALLRGLAAEGRTVFLSSHLMAEMEKTAERVIIIDRGRLVEDVGVEELTVRAAGSRVEVDSEDNPRLEAGLIRRGAQVTSMRTDGGDALEVRGLDPLGIGSVARDLGIALSKLIQERVSLEDAFLMATRSDDRNSEEPSPTRAEEK